MRRVARKIKHMFDKHPDEYFRERRGDIDFVGDRILRNLMGEAADVDEAPPDAAMVVAHDLSPGDAAKLCRAGGRGFLTDSGAQTWHTAIVAGAPKSRRWWGPAASRARRER